MGARRSCGQFYGHFFMWLTNLSNPQTAGPHTSNPNQVGGTLCISIASTALFGGYLRYNDFCPLLAFDS